MKLTYTLSREILRPGVAAHYDHRCGKLRYFRLAIYFAMILLGILFIMDGRNRTIYLGTVMIAFGVLSLFRKRLYIWRSLNSFFKTQDDSPEIELTVDDKGVGIESAHTSGRMDWKGLVDFKEVATGILLYPQTNIFYWVPATAKIEGGTWSEMLQKIEKRVSRKV